MINPNHGSELDGDKFDPRLVNEDPNWRWSRWLYYDIPLTGLGRYDGKPVFYQITDHQELVTAEEANRRNFDDRLTTTYVLYEASEEDFKKAQHEQAEWEAADAEYRKVHPKPVEGPAPPHSQKSIDATEADSDRLRTNPVLGWVHW